MIKKIINQTLKKAGYQFNKVEEPFKKGLYLKLYSKDSLENKRFYNVGAGSFFHPYWTNIDYMSDWYKKNDNLTKKGINYNIFSLKPIPVESGKAELVYSSHTIEHIKDEHAQFFFNEAFRMLKMGGGNKAYLPKC